MFARLLPLIVALSFVASAGHAQPSADLELPEPCRGERGGNLPALEKRKQRLERDIAQMTGTTGPRHSKTKQKAGAQDEVLRKNQEALLRVIFQIECLNARLALEAKKKIIERAPQRPYVSSAGNLIEVTLYYATNRSWSGGAEPGGAYSSDSETTLNYGRAIVTIPITHSLGNIERPSFWSFAREADPKKHFVLKSVVQIETDGALREIREKFQGSSKNSLLLFVHGYNTSFREAAMRTAQLAHDLKFAGMPFFFSWPSAAQVIAYLKDAESAQLSEPAFDQLLDDLSGLPVNQIFIIAHSLGSRIVSQTLKSRVDRGKRTNHVSELLLAAPDINADLFRKVIAPKLAAMQGTHTTVYASSSDLALRASKAVYGFTRLGEILDGYRDWDTIDATSLSLVTRAFGHSYLMDSPRVLKDVGSIIQGKRLAKDRELIEFGTPPNMYWKLR